MAHHLKISGYWLRSIIISFAAMSALVVLVFVLSGMNAGAAELHTPDNPDPFPEPNDPSVPLTASVGIGYDEAINPATVSTRTFVVQAMQSGQVLAAYGVHGGQIFLTPTIPFRPGEIVYASATTGTLSAIDGTGPLTPTVWQFQAEAPAGAGQFFESGVELGINRTALLALGDLDRDGDLDIVLGNDARPSEVWLNEPDPETGYLGAYALAQSLGTYNTWDVDLGDLDGDGDLDIFFANGSEPNVVWFNMGGQQGGVPGVFTDSQQSLAGSSSFGAALGDLDGDGDLDSFVVSADGAGCRVWLNAGGLQGGVMGVFIDSGQLLGTFSNWDVALGDVDLDGDLDAVTTVWNGQDRLWLNNGDATFVDSGQLLANDRAAGIIMGDVDDDGDLDIFVGRDTNRPDQLFLNQGGLQGGTTGVYSPSQVIFPPSRTNKVAMGDVDGDDDLDLIVSGRSGTPSTIWLNDGVGQFSITNTVLITDMADSFTIAAGDVNNDGDLDVVIGYNFEDDPNRIWRNNSAPQIMDIDLPAIVEEGTLITVGLTISSTDAPDEILTLEVDWGDGLTTTVEFPAQDNILAVSHIYENNRPDEDPYTIQFLVKDPEGGEDSASAALAVTNVPPTLESWLLTTPLQEGETATLSGEMFDPGADALVLSLNWGEGMQEVHHYPVGTTTFSLTHTYLDDNPSGTPSDPYTVSMILLDEDLDLDQGEAFLTVYNLEPEANAGPDQKVTLGAAITLTGKYSDPGSEDTHITWWDLGDGTIISDTLMLTHTYAAAGQFTVTFHVLDDDTGMATSMLQVTVVEPEPADFPVYFPIVINKP